MRDKTTILITGASSGLGRALAIRLANKNTHVAIMSRDKGRLQETASMCEHSPLLIAADITSESSCQAAIAKVIDHYGRLDHLVLNAGISMWSRFEDLADLTAIHELIQTNYMGAVNCTWHALPYLKKTHGMITVISSIQGKIGVPFHTGYAASKHALEGFFNSLRTELHKQMDILIVSPGWIRDTELKMRALGRKPENPAKKTSRQAITLDFCCKEIISAIKQRKRELIIPKKYYYLPWIKLISPSFLDNLIRRSF